MLQGETREGSLLEHLEELRAVILRMLLCISVLFPLLFYFSDSLLKLIVAELCPAGMTLKFFSPVEPLMVQLKIAFYGAIFVGAPYLLMQVWGFVAPGLYSREKAVAGWLLFSSWLLFALGAAFSLMVILPLVMKFSFTYESVFLQAAIGIGQFVSLIIMLMLGFGLMFQFPVGVFILIVSGIVKIEKIRAARSYIIVAVFIMSALLTPPDVMSQVLMGVPTWLLFEIGLLAASIVVKFRKTHSDQAEHENGKKPGNPDDVYETIGS
ncbi:MAG: twin-arginine translocase subunit TatC, partial [Candidatus Riflebacteria bacterium]